MRTQLYVAMAVIFGLGECGLGYVLWRLYLKQQIKPVMLLLTAALTWTTSACDGLHPSLARLQHCGLRASASSAAVHSVALSVSATSA